MVKAKKKFGQNFLINDDICKKIVSFENITGKNILEIGPGNLALTNAISKNDPKRFVAVEIDKELFEYNKNKNLINCDALKLNERKIFNNQKFSIISNLPFNISSELLLKWCKIQNIYNCIDSMTLMFQKELAERIISNNNSKKYGRISIIVGAFFSVEKKLFVPKKFFEPMPKVDTIVLKFSCLKKNKIDPKNINKLEKITSFFFNERRKKNEKKIKKLFNKDKIEKNNLTKYFNKRPENIEKETYYKMLTIV